jgi:hypothetical protein
LIALNVPHLQLTLDQLRNLNVIQKRLSGLKNALQKPLEAFQGFQYWISRVSRKILLDFAISSKQNATRIRKITQ